MPSGASTGRHEALEFRDGDPDRYQGKGVRHAVRHVNEVLGPVVLGMDATRQHEVDALLLDTDGTPNLRRLGGNAVLGVSLATAHAAAESLGLPLYRYLGGSLARELPVPMVNILSGGLHARGIVDFQDFLLIPVGAQSFSDALVMVRNVYYAQWVKFWRIAAQAHWSRMKADTAQPWMRLKVQPAPKVPRSLQTRLQCGSWCKR